LSYPFNGESKDGPLFVAQQMEDKWDIYLYESNLYFARSWTGDLVLRAAIVFKEKVAAITEVEASRVMDDPALAVRTGSLHQQRLELIIVQGEPRNVSRLTRMLCITSGTW
jgi:hypothetical protein